MRKWTVAGGLLLSGPDLLLVRNRRRNGSHDWTPPGGVVDPGESVLEALTREVVEETGFAVTVWSGPVYDICVDFVDLDMELRVEAFVAGAWRGDLVVADPDGIVDAAEFMAPALVADRLAASPLWVREPLMSWAEEPQLTRTHRYRAIGNDHESLRVEPT